MSTESRQSPLDDLENELLAGSRSPVPAALGDRVLGAVRGELRRGGIREWASTLALAAACAVLWLNLSWSAVNRIEEFNPARPEVRSIDSVASDIQRILPWTTDDQALSFALTLRAAARIDPCPEVHPPPVAWHDLSRFRGQP